VKTQPVSLMSFVKPRGHDWKFFTLASVKLIWGRIVQRRGRDLIPIPNRFESNPTLANGVWIVAMRPSRIQSDLEAV
jgi:hypothetical protein